MSDSTEIYQDTEGKYRFRIKAPNGEIVASSEGYSSRSAALNGVAALHRAVTTDADGEPVE